MHRRYNLVVALLFILFFIITLTCTIVLINRFDKQEILDTAMTKETVRFELIKFLLQLLIIIIIGGVIFKLVEWSREQTRLRIQTRVDYINRLGKIYRTVKLVRRELRAGGLTTKYGRAPNTIRGSYLEVYNLQLKNLNQAQLELEGLKVEAKYLPAFVTSKVTYRSLKAMEEYLSSIVAEYEEMSHLLNSNDPPIAFNKFICLNNFTCSTDATRKDSNRSFIDCFADKYRNTIKSLI